MSNITGKSDSIAVLNQAAAQALQEEEGAAGGAGDGTPAPSGALAGAAAATTTGVGKDQAPTQTFSRRAERPSQTGLAMATRRAEAFDNEISDPDAPRSIKQALTLTAQALHEELGAGDIKPEGNDFANIVTVAVQNPAAYQRWVMAVEMVTVTDGKSAAANEELSAATRGFIAAGVPKTNVATLAYLSARIMQEAQTNEEDAAKELLAGLDRQIAQLKRDLELVTQNLERQSVMASGDFKAADEMRVQDFDANKDGQLSQEELKTGNAAENAAMLRVFDADGDGKIEKTELADNQVGAAKIDQLQSTIKDLEKLRASIRKGSEAKTGQEQSDEQKLVAMLKGILAANAGKPVAGADGGGPTKTTAPTPGR